MKNTNLFANNIFRIIMVITFLLQVPISILAQGVYFYLCIKYQNMSFYNQILPLIIIFMMSVSLYSFGLIKCLNYSNKKLANFYMFLIVITIVTAIIVLSFENYLQNSTWD